MNRLMGLYAQHLGAIQVQNREDAPLYREAIARASELIANADAVVVGIGSGMSSACGYDYYHPIPALEEGGTLAAFSRAHGFTTLMDGFYHLYASNEERWGYLAAYIDWMESVPVGEPYRQLRGLLEGREYFVLTTNIDGQVRRSFPKERTWLFQGDCGRLQCSQPCCDELWESSPAIRRVLDAMDADSVRPPADALPRCPRCGWLMMPWMRDEGFLEGTAWHEGKRRYEAFVSRALGDAGRVLFLELGVGGMTPSVIEIPFWRMVRANSNAFYLRINLGKSSEPQQLGERSLTIGGDIARVLSDLSTSKGDIA